MHLRPPSKPWTHAVVDTGTTSIFVMKSTAMSNVPPATQPLTINLPYRTIVKSTLICDVMVLGLANVLDGHIVPGLTVASLVAILILCKAGCIVVFTDTACYVMYNQKVILTGAKDPSTDLWTLPITPGVATSSQGGQWTTPGISPPQAGPCIACAPWLPLAQPPPADLATFTHSVCTQANAIKFVHQLLCYPKISSLLKVLQKSFLKGCPIINEELITKYLNPSPATAKGHMKRPKKGIRSTQLKQVAKTSEAPAPVPQIAPQVLPIFDEPPLSMAPG